MMGRDGPARPRLSGSSSDRTAGETAAPLCMEQSVTVGRALLQLVQKRYDSAARTGLAPVPPGTAPRVRNGHPAAPLGYRHTPAASWKRHCAFGSARCSSWSTRASICDTSCCVRATSYRANPTDAAIAAREAVAVGRLANTYATSATCEGGHRRCAAAGLLGIGMHADCENAALSPADVGDAVPAYAVEGRALSGP